ncbi:urease accessory protein UreF [uncultured Cohaesibacter sp.]|uniref:urease accessory protein UreF n=1 Tax=uncultured Cohaesibacter sp. TaxID=1002546 RepID=UPI00292DF4FD|nr:urease accessory protein UreF [uncultured Cohaesibacter sp.]
MSDFQLHQLFSWLSPSYPTGAFSYSHGLEYAVAGGTIRTSKDLELWLGDILSQGSGWNDALLLSHAYRAETDAQWFEIAELAEALCASKERHLETMAQGRAFAKVTSAVWGLDLKPAALPVCLGRAAALQSIDLSRTLRLYLHAFAANIISAGVRFIPLGQTEGQQVLAALFELIDEISVRAERAELSQVGGICFLADMASMQHETMKTRIFRT